MQSSMAFTNELTNLLFEIKFVNLMTQVTLSWFMLLYKLCAAYNHHIHKILTTQPHPTTSAPPPPPHHAQQHAPNPHQVKGKIIM